MTMLLLATPAATGLFVSQPALGCSANRMGSSWNRKLKCAGPGFPSLEGEACATHHRSPVIHLNAVDDKSSVGVENRTSRSGRGYLPAELTPITTGVFSQMLGEGIAMSSLPLYLTRLGAEPLVVGLAISCFSVAQMTFAPGKRLNGDAPGRTLGRSVRLSPRARPHPRPRG